MRFACDQCSAQYMIADEKIGDKGVRVKCKKCSNVITVKPQAAAQESTEEPAAAEQPQSQDTQTHAQDPQPQAAAGGGDAFDSLFGQDPFGGTQSGAQAPEQTLAATSDAGPKEWYIAIGDEQVGPVSITEIEQRWQAGDASEESLAWKGGMADWLPIADIADLAYLVTQYPQEKAPASSSSGVPSTLSNATVSEATLGGSGSGTEIDWKPSAASALSSLVQEELVATQQPAASPPADESLSGMPSFGADSTVAPSASTSPALPGASAAPSFGGGDAGWSVPSGPPKSAGGSSKALLLVLGLLAVGILGIGGVLAYKFFVHEAEPAAPVVAAKDSETVKAKKAEESKGAENPDIKEPKKVADASADNKTPSPKTTPKKSKTSKPKTVSKPKTTPKAKPKPAAPKVEKVYKSMNDFTVEIKKNYKNLAACIGAAKSAGEIVPGKYTFLLKFTIQPNGRLSSTALTGPASVMGTSLPPCFGKKMRSWQFAAPGKVVGPVKYPFPVPVK